MHRWIDDRHLMVGDTAFDLMGAGASSGDGAFSLFKPRYMVEEYLQRAVEFHGGRVFEAGIFRGGSTAFLAALLDPEKLVAIDLNQYRNQWLDRWLEERGQQDNVHLHHGIDQADRRAVTVLLDEEFGDKPLDLVIDDASHKLTPTLETFQLLFPRLRPGGLFIIEDWSSHLSWYRLFSDRPDVLARALEARPELLLAKMQEEPELTARALEAWPDLQAAVAKMPADLPEVPADHGFEKQMWRLILRLVVVAGGYRELIPDLHIQQGFVALHRGPAELDPETFDLNDWLLQSFE